MQEISIGWEFAEQEKNRKWTFFSPFYRSYLSAYFSDLQVLQNDRSDGFITEHNKKNTLDLTS